MSRSAKPHHRNRVDASVSGGERQTPGADESEQCGEAATAFRLGQARARGGSAAYARSDRLTEWAVGGVAGARHALPRGLYRARPALACIIGARRAWTVEMISSEEIPCR